MAISDSMATFSNTNVTSERGDDSVMDVLSLSPVDPLNLFDEIFYAVFIWALFSSLLIHCVAFIIAFCRLRKHRVGRWIPLLIIIMGVASPLTGGVVTSAAVAAVYRASSIVMLPSYAVIWGVGQTFVVVVISFVRIVATL